MTRPEIVAALEQYVERFQLPVQFGARVESVEPLMDESGYLIKTGEELYEAHNVVIATGLFQRPKIPVFSADLSSHITQLHSGQYRNPQSLHPGGVLVVGSAQSGCQIAEELYLSGRQVYLCVSSAGRASRRYRGKDVYEWLYLSGFLDQTVGKLPSPKAKFAPNPQLSGRDGGRSLNLHQFARDGVGLVGSYPGWVRRQGLAGPQLERNRRCIVTTIETERLAIRNFKASDWEDLHRMIAQYEASEFAAYDQQWPTAPVDIKGVAEWFASGDSFLAVCLKDTGRFIGFVSLNPEQKEAVREYNLGYIFNFDYHGKGYATEACRAVVAHAFGALQADGVITVTAGANRASCKLLERLGFKKTAENTGSFRTSPDGKPIEFLGYTYFLSRKDWEVDGKNK